MTKASAGLLALVAATLLAATPAHSQSSSFVFSYALVDGNVHTLSDGTVIQFPAVDINATTTATVSIINQGTATGTVSNILVAGTGFQLVNSTLLPATVAAGQTLKFGIVFAPTTAGSYSGSFRIDLIGRSVGGTLTASTALPILSLSYIDPNTNNVLPLANAATLQFPSTAVGTQSVITVQASNNGAGTGSISSITVVGSSSSPFQLLGLPPFPIAVPPNQQLRFGVRFSPQQSQSASDVLRVNLNGQTTMVNLQGQGTQAQFSYTAPLGGGIIPILPGGSFAMVDTAVGANSSLVITVTNSGTGDGQISAIGVTGQGLSVTDAPALPFTLHPGGSQHFTLTFAPTQPGAISGRLTVGSDTFTVTVTGLGPRLVFAYTNASSAVSLSDGGVVIFSPLAVGGTGSLSFSIQNSGTSSAAISSINLTTSSTVFSLSQLPSLPIKLDPNATLSFQVNFIPNNTGSVTATLQVNTSSFTLSGNGTQPAPLPSYTFQGVSGNLQPAQQPTVGLTLASPYPAPLQGTLNLTFVSDVFIDDPSIQFASGGRSVNFTIPANSTQAVFGGNAMSVPLQTGTTAGSIILTPSFTMTGGFSLTPSNPPVLTLTIPRSAAQLSNASISAETLNSFTLILSGYTTTRALKQLEIQVTPNVGQNFSTSHLTIDLNSAATSWFQGTASQGFGGTFMVAIPFNLSNGSTTTDLVHLLQSLSITATNDVGVSSALSVSIP
jgi:hypothetical protein